MRFKNISCLSAGAALESWTCALRVHSKMRDHRTATVLSLGVETEHHGGAPNFIGSGRPFASMGCRVWWGLRQREGAQAVRSAKLEQRSGVQQNWNERKDARVHSSGRYTSGHDRRSICALQIGDTVHLCTYEIGQEGAIFRQRSKKMDKKVNF